MKKESNTNTSSFDTFIRCWFKKPFFFRRSRLEVFCKKGVLRNFAKFTGEYLCQGLRPATLFKKRLWYRCFTVNFAKFLRTRFLKEHLQWLLLFVEDAIPLRNFEFRKKLFYC